MLPAAGWRPDGRAGGGKAEAATTTDLPRFGALLKRHRLAAGLTQEALAGQAGLSARAVSDLERDPGRRPRLESLALLATALGLSPEQHAHLRAAARLGPRGQAKEQAGTLPAYLNSFVGREAASAEVGRRLGATRLLTLIGAGGCGKTRLAVQVAADLVGAYPAGVWFVDLAPLTAAALVPGAVLAALGLTEAPGRSAAAAVSAHLGGRSGLLLLDNCEHLIAACASMAEELLGACPGLRVLATSREPLGAPGELVWRVPSLPAPGPDEPPDPGRLAAYPAVRLFVERAAAAEPTFDLTVGNAAAVARVCRRLDGIPLALEMAAARVRVLTPEQIAARLDDRFELLTGGSRTAPTRQQTLRAALDWSHDLLAEPERALLRRLGVFVGGWTLEAAEAVCAGGPVGPGDVLAGLSALIDKSLVLADVKASQGRYRLLETVRAYALDRSTEPTEAAAVGARHAAYYLTVAERAAPVLKGPEQVDCLDRLEQERGNIRAALGWWVEHGEAAPALRLVGALGWFWAMRGHLVEGRSWMARALALAGDADPAARASALARATLLAWMQGDLDAARTAGAEAVETARRARDAPVLVDALLALGPALYDRGQRADAELLFAEGLSAARAAGYRWGTALALFWSAVAALGRADPAAARVHLEESLALSRALGDPRGAAFALSYLGTLARRRGDLSEAEALFAESLTLRRAVGPRRGVVHELNNLGLVARARGEHVRAHALHCEALALAGEIGDRPTVVFTLEAFAGLAAASARPAHALRLAAAAAALRTEMGLRNPPEREEELRAWLRPARRALGPARSAAAWAEGQAMDAEAAVARAASSAPASQPAAGPTILSPREREVARLIARGHTNRQIAEALVIAASTAERHVANVLAKLGAHRRAEVGAWAARHLPEADDGVD
jgi:predicted ATPase/DNA-binding CsgD family transcriptional regulator/DNA-binding XRE family transcriptional regulator